MNKDGQWIEWYGADGMEQIIHPTNPDYVIGNLQNGGKRKSKNATLTNENVSNPSGVTFDWIAPLAYNPLNFNTVYSVGNSLCRSRDFGASFSKLYSFGSNVHEFAIAENNSAIMLASINSTLYKSTNGGVTFSVIGAGVLPSHFIRDIEFDPKDDNTFIVVYNQYNNNNARVYITRNGGTTWQNISYNLSAIPAYSVVIDHSPEKNIYIGTETGVFVKSMASTSYSVFGTGLPPIGVYELEINFGANALKLASWGRGHWETHLKDRANYPEIEEVSFSSNIAEGVTVGQQFHVFAKVENINTVSKMFIKYSTNNIALNQTIDMMRMNDNMYVSSTQMQSIVATDSTYFRVYAVSPTNDTTETYRFMYKSINKPPYCSAAGSSGTGSDWINRVKVGSDEKTSSQSAYSDFTSTVFSIPQFQSKVIQIRLNFGFSQDKAFAWVDWNQSGVFDSNEAIVLSAYNGSFEASGTISVPHNVADGDYRLRVRNAYNEPNAIACGNYSGEVEDYTLRVSSACNSNPMVSNLNNAYLGSLRQELENACPNDTIHIVAGLQGDTLQIYNSIMVNKEISILGHSSNNFTFSGENQVNIFQAIRPLFLENLNLIKAAAPAPNGGAIVNYSNLTLKKVLFDGNKEGSNDKAFTNYGNVTVLSGLTEIKQ
jgi:GEVED domain/Sortilin, neurotensin receptor 3,